MSFLSFLGLGSRARDPLGRPPAQRIYIVDAAGVMESRLRNGNIQPSPRDNYLVLRNLAQFAGRERIALVAVFIGRPLREAGEGREYKGVRVHYVENAEGRPQKMLRLVRENIGARDVVLITGDADLEREAARLNAACLRPSTLRKAMDEREDRGEREDRPQRHGHYRQPMDRRQESQRQEPQRPERQPEPERQPAAEPQPETPQHTPENEAPRPPEAEQKEKDRDKPEPGVLDLIDPV